MDKETMYPSRASSVPRAPLKSDFVSGQSLDSIAKRCRDVLETHYGDRVAEVILFGSVARGDADSESDLDLLIVLREPLDYFRELRAISELLYPVQLDSERLISAKPAAAKEFERGAIQLYRNARKEGIRL